VVDGEKLEVEPRDEEKHTERNDLLFVDKMKYSPFGGIFTQ